MQVEIENPSDLYSIAFSEALELAPGTILKAQDGSLAMVVVDYSHHVDEAAITKLLLLGNRSALIKQTSGYSWFCLTKLDTMVLKTSKV